jgi:hypothetical protein
MAHSGDQILGLYPQGSPYTGLMFQPRIRVVA